MTHRQRKARKRRGNAHVRSRLLLGFGMVVAVLLIAALSAVGWIISVAASAPDIEDLKPIDKGTSSQIIAADGSRLGYVQAEQVRTPIDWSDMPVRLKQATVAIEDKRFYEHGGIDPEGIFRSVVKNV